MILTDREIRIALQEKTIIIDPMPDLAVAITSTAMDLTLSNVFRIWSTLKGMQLRPGDTNYKYSEVAEKFQTKHIGQYILKPQNFVLAWTKEKLSLPVNSRLGARIEGKSSLSRLGVSVHFTAPTIHSGYKGNIQLEMFNFGPHEVVLDPGMWVCQLIFEQTLGTPETGYDRMFADQSD